MADAVLRLQEGSSTRAFSGSFGLPPGVAAYHYSPTSLKAAMLHYSSFVTAGDLCSFEGGFGAEW